MIDVNSHVCILRKIPDPLNDGEQRWALSYEDICICQIVITLREGSLLCHPRSPPKWMFIDSIAALTSRENRNTESLDDLLNRTMNCGKLEYHYQTTFICKGGLYSLRGLSFVVCGGVCLIVFPSTVGCVLNMFITFILNNSLYYYCHPSLLRDIPY